MSKARKSTGNKVGKKDGKKVPAVEAASELEEEEVPRPEWECFVVWASQTEKTSDGKEMVFSCAEPAPQAVRVRLMLDTIVFPRHLFRQDGRWCMSFDFAGQEGPSPVLAVKCGEGGVMPLEEAASLFYGGVPESAKLHPRNL